MQNTVGRQCQRTLQFAVHRVWRGMSSKLNCPSDLLPSGHITLALQDMNGHRRLVVGGGGKHFGGFSRYCRVFVNQPRHYAAFRFNAQRQRRYIQQQHILDITLLKRPPAPLAPMATASSGLTSLRGSTPKISSTFFCTCGILVMPPTRITSLILPLPKLASFKAVWQGPLFYQLNGRLIFKCGAGDFFTKCLGPVWSAVM